MIPINIRPALPADVEAIVRLSNAGGPGGTPVTTIPATLPAGYQQAFARIMSNPNDKVMVAEIDGQIVGTFQITFLTNLTGGGRDDCQIESVHVAAAWRSKGIGKQMMDWAIAQAKHRGCRRVQLTTNKMRKDAHRFYETLGFALTHEGAKLVLNNSL